MFTRQCGGGLRRTIAAALFAAAIAALPHSALALERVTYLLPALIFLPAFGPWIVSRQRGYYAAEGLEINFETTRGGADVAKQIGVGNAVIGGAMGDTPIIVRGNGVPVRSVASLSARAQLSSVRLMPAAKAPTLLDELEHAGSFKRKFQGSDDTLFREWRATA
jgi:ABC-type nitrate/sulfonate/bicarbonate transport system substrate-binding protein